MTHLRSLHITGCIFLATLLSSFVLITEQPKRFDQIVREDFFAGFAGDTTRFASAMKLCEDSLAVNPNHPEALVWHGSGVTYLSGMAFAQGDAQKGMELWTKGNEEMDKAATIAPNHVGVLIPRGATLLASGKNMPEPFAKPVLEKGLGDYVKAVGLQQGYFDKLSTHARGELLGGIADGYLNLKDTANAKIYFEKIKAQLPKTEYAKQADKWFKGKSYTGVTCIGCHKG